MTMFAQNGTAVVPSTPRPTAPPESMRQTLTLSTEAIATLLDVEEATEERSALRVEAAVAAFDAAKRERDAANVELTEAARNATLLRDQLGLMQSGDTVTATLK